MYNTYANGTTALKMPSSYVLMDAEEMTYVDGGTSWSASMFAKNLMGLWNNTAAARHAMKCSGFTYGNLAAMAYMSYEYIAYTLAGSLFCSVSVVNAFVGALVAVSVVYAVNYLGKHQKFY